MSECIIYNVQDVMKILKLSQARTYELFHSEGFPRIKIGACLRVRKEDFEEWLEKQVQKN